MQLNKFLIEHAILIDEIIKLLFYLLFVYWEKSFQIILANTGVMFFFYSAVFETFFFLLQSNMKTNNKNSDVRRLRSRSMRSVYNQLSIWKAQ